MYKSIAIDGPAGAGKSTISKLFAKKIDFDYLDTGAMYRLFTYYYLLNDIDIRNEELLKNKIENINIELKDGKFYLNDTDVSKEIRSDQVTKNVSLISSYKSVREHLVKLQREIASKSNIILDGRDIGSYVLKDADIKFYLDASPEVRAKRRLNQMPDNSLSYQEVLDEINKRDYTDSNREISPLKMAEDAILIDSSNMTINDVIQNMKKYCEEKNVL